jgi:hypothetical protein
MVELRAENAFHACTLIGWRPKNCKVVDVIKSEENNQISENNAIVAESNEKETQKENTGDSADGGRTVAE